MGSACEQRRRVQVRRGLMHALWTSVYTELTLASGSLWPLLRRDGLAIQYFALLAAWNGAIGYNPWRLRGRTLKGLSLVRSAT